MTRKRRLRQKAMRALGRQIRESGSRLPLVLIPVTMVISSLAAGHVTGATFALNQDVGQAQSIQFQALTTSQVLRFTSGRVQLVEDGGPDQVGSEVVRVFRIMNISDRRVDLSVELTGIPWARAALSRSVLGPGETAEIVVSGTPDQPGQYQGYLTVYGMGGFLELGMEFTVVIVPAPDPCRPAEWPAPGARGGEASGDPVREPDPEETEESGAVIGLHPDLLGLPVDDAPEPAAAEPDGEPEAPEAADEAGHEPGEGAGEPAAPGDDGSASESGDEAVPSGDGVDGGAAAPPDTTDPCADAPGGQLPDPAPDCGVPAEAVVEEEEGEQAAEPDDCAPAAAPPDDEAAEPGDGDQDGRKEEDEDAAGEPVEDDAEGTGDPHDDELTEGDTAGEPEDDADDSGSGAEQPGDAVGGTDEAADDGIAGGDGDAGSGETDSDEPDSAGPEDGAPDDGDPGDSDDADGPGAEDADADTGDADGGSPGGEQAHGDSAGDDGADPDDTGQPLTGSDAADDADAGGQTT